MVKTVSGIDSGAETPKFDYKPLEFESREAFDKFMSATDKPTLLKLGAPWCAPCNIFDKNILAVMKRFGDRVNFVKINTEQPWGRALADEWSVTGIPQVFYIKPNFERVGSDQGAKASGEYIARISHLFFDDGDGTVTVSPERQAAREAAAKRREEAKKFH